MANSVADLNRDTPIIPAVLKTRANDSRVLHCFKLFSHTDSLTVLCLCTTTPHVLNFPPETNKVF